jgi:prepilin-type N-terminal cleavage/methylation domain-containing protein
VFHHLFERYGEIQSRRHDEETTEKGFTLIELLIVIVVLGILAAIVIFSLTSVTGSSAAAACNSDAKTVETAVQAFIAQTGGNPTSVDYGGTGGALEGQGDLVPTYLHTWPTAGSGAKYQITYTNSTAQSPSGEVQVSINGATPTNYDNGGACTGA